MRNGIFVSGSGPASTWLATLPRVPVLPLVPSEIIPNVSAAVVSYTPKAIL